MNRKEAAELLGVTERTIKRWVEFGKLPSMKKDGQQAFDDAVLLLSANKEEFQSTRHQQIERIIEESRFTNLDEMLTIMDIDQTKWNVDKITANTWGKQGANVQLKAVLTRKENLDPEQIEQIFNNFPAHFKEQVTYNN
jgi:excisionase family DNA binding protein